MAQGKSCPECDHPMTAVDEDRDEEFGRNIVHYECNACGNEEEVTEWD